MQNPAIAIICGPCGVAINPVLHPQAETLISCPQCGATDTYAEVQRICFEDVAARFKRATNPDVERPATKWAFRG